MASIEGVWPQEASLTPDATAEGLQQIGYPVTATPC